MAIHISGKRFIVVFVDFFKGGDILIGGFIGNNMACEVDILHGLQLHLVGDHNLNITVLNNIVYLFRL